MPKRATLTFSSDDAPNIQSEKLYVYYCKYSGRHALTTDCNLAKAPRRRTDQAAVIDTKKHSVKLYTTDGGMKLVKRKAGAIEKQYRFNVGRLQIGYRCLRTGCQPLSVCGPPVFPYTCPVAMLEWR